jgi:protein phosphatase
MMSFEYYGTSDLGLRRKHNEDHFVVDPDLGFFAVADGMGGHPYGEKASRIAIQTAHDAIRNSKNQNGFQDVNDETSISAASHYMKEIILQANQKILSCISEKNELRGMGTTIVAVKLVGQATIIGHVGDSRAYLIRGRTIQQLTTDHSWVNEQIKAGHLKKSEAGVHPLRNIITRALGIGENVDVEVANQKISADDILILCSDGLNTSLSDNEIMKEVLENKGDLKKACHNLIQRVNSNGGEDNTTIIAVKFQS